MKKMLCVLLALCLLATSVFVAGAEEPHVAPTWPAGQEDRVLTWKDPALLLAMRRVTGVFDRDIMLSDVYPIEAVTLGDANIVDFSGLAQLPNLTDLTLSGYTLANLDRKSVV